MQPIQIIQTTPIDELDMDGVTPLDDNLDELVPTMQQQNQLPQFTPDATIETAVNANNDIPVVVCRGDRLARVQNITVNQTAGGVTPADPHAGRPTAQEAKNQAQLGRLLPEYGAKGPSSYGWRHGMVIVRIQSRYLTRGSKVEAGWVAYPAAPVQVLAAFDRTVGRPEPAGEPNAS